MEFYSNKAKIIGILIFLIALYFFSKTIPETRSDLQQSFDSWLKLKEPTLVNLSQIDTNDTNRDSLPSSLGMSLPTISLQIISEETGKMETYKAQNLHKPEHVGYLLRLLQLLREADLFSLAERSNLSKATLDVTISVSDGNKFFYCSVAQKDISKNLKAMVFLKLFKEYFKNQVMDSTPSRA